MSGLLDENSRWKVVWKKKKNILYVWLGHFAVQQKLKEHCKSTVLHFKLKKKKKRIAHASILSSGKAVKPQFCCEPRIK